MKKGFTLIEVVVSLMIISIFLAVIINENSSVFSANAFTKNRDVEYNLARGICEKFKSEAGVVQSKTVVIYLDNLLELPVSIIDAITYGVNTVNYSCEAIKSFNLQNKNFAIILEGYESEYIYDLKVTVLSMRSNDTGVALRIAR
jgi:prepilin-type N-terminal cleavage/methylation domain-containing protein